MREKDHIKLNVLSNIDEPIIDEVTDKRIALTQSMQVAARKARRRWITIGSIAASLLLVCTIFLAVLALLPGMAVPVYQGMTIRKAQTATLEAATDESPGMTYLSVQDHTRRSPKKDEHKGHGKGLEKKINEIVDIEVAADSEVRYYVRPSETFIIEVHISNPNNYEIQSFTLNGKKYANYMFKEGSTMEVLLLEVTAPASSGYVEYTIDAIKYIDGTEIKDVDMSSGDKSIKAGVAYPTAPTAEITSQTIATTALDLAVQVTDPHDLIGDNTLAIYLSDGEQIVDQQPLQVGDNTVTFTDLLMSKTYEYGIITAYDLVDGRETHAEWLLTDQITTMGAFAISDVAPTKDSISFEVSRIGEIGEINTVSLYDATTNELVESAGADVRTFSNLLSNHTYNLYVDFSYTVDNTEVRDWVAAKEITTASKQVPTPSFGEVTADKGSISYSVNVTDPDNILTVTRVELLLDTESVGENGTALSGTFDGLLSNTKYTVRVTYTYDLGEGQGAVVETVAKDIKTRAKTAPTLTFDTCTSDKSSVSYAINTRDVDGILSVSKVELLKGTESVRENGTALSGIFDGLLSNNKYTVRVTYTYDLGDGQGAITKSATKELTTMAKNSPSFTFSNIAVTDTQMSGLVTMKDTDAVGSMISADLYQDTVLVQKNTSRELSFTGLSYYTDYKIVVSYAYDLNDGRGTQKSTVAHNFTTSPYLQFNNCSVINTSAVSDGETIFLQVNITNPNRVVYESIVVNGEEYAVVKNSSTATMLVCEIVNNGQFEGGNNTLTIEKVIAELDGKTYTVEPQSNNTANVFINGILEVVKINVVVPENGRYVEPNYICASDEAYLQIVLNNKTGYSIDSVEVGPVFDSSSLIKLDDEHYLIDLQRLDFYGTGVKSTSLYAVHYSKGELQKTLTLEIGYTFFRLESDDVHYISTADDLLHMNDGYYYELTNDIDLAGMEWRGSSFCGVFNGNGYAIKNMSFVGTVTNRDADFGLFASANGVIENLNIEGARFVIKQEVTDGNNDYYLNVGCIAATTNGMVVIENCTVDETTYINIDHYNGSVGGIFGYTYEKETAYRGKISNCINNGYIAANQSYDYRLVVQSVGGIAGRFPYVINCTNNGTVIGKEAVGGILGEAQEQAFGGLIAGCVNNGSVSGHLYIGGIVGRTYVTITDCENFGNVEGSYLYIGGIAGSLGKNNFILVSTCTNNGTISGSSYVGGIIGIIGFGVYNPITNCVNNGNVTAEEKAGGIIGHHKSPKEELTVEKCVNNGTITAQTGAGGIIGRIKDTVVDCVNTGTVTGYTSNGGEIVGENLGTITNCYILGQNVTATELSSKAFYTDVLGFDETIWDLDDLNAAAGKFPALRQP